MRVLTGLGLVALGVVVGVAALWTHGRWWALALGAAATLATELAVAGGLRRILYAGGWVTASAYFLFARPEGDFAVASDRIGYAFLGLGLLVILLAVATVPPRRRVPDGAGRTT